MRMLFAFLFLFLTSCAGEDELRTGETPSQPTNPEVKPIPAKPAAGVIRGQPWKFLSGQAVILRSRRVPVLEIAAFSSEHEDPCEVRRPLGPAIRVVLPPKEGSYSLGKDPFDIYPNLFFIDSTKHSSDRRFSLAANDGRVEIVALRKDFVIIRVDASYSGPEEEKRTQVQGQFAVPLCSGN